MPRARIASITVLASLGIVLGGAPDAFARGTDTSPATPSPATPSLKQAQKAQVVNVGKKAPQDAYIDIRYGPSQYWIDRGDFDSKYAFTVVQMLMALAETNQDAKTPIVTIPAG